jgi:AcrR family transcriptional regulator
MPKVVDREQRREELAAALWRLVVREGIEAASVRRVAAEAGWSTGSLRHYFATHSELLTFAMELVMQRVTDRVGRLWPSDDPRETAARVLHEVLPLDDERHAEMQVWLAFTTRSLVEPELRELRDRAHTGLRELCATAVGLLGGGAAEAERVHALIDGLALHAVLDSQTTTPERQLQLLGAELDALSPPGTPARAATGGSPPPGSPSDPAP